MKRRKSPSTAREAKILMEQLEDRRVLATVTLNTDIGLPGELRTEIANAAAGETIDFNLLAGLETITLVAGELRIDKDLQIDGDNAAGSGVDATISGGGLSRVMYLDDGDDGVQSSIALSNLTITGGDTTTDPGSQDGGGIISYESLTLTNATVTGNFAADDGGGIASFGDSLTIEQSAIDGNSSEDRGGGIFGYGSISITNSSTVSGNTINTALGDALGAGLHLGAGTNTIIDDSEVSNNYAMTTYYDPVNMVTLSGRGAGLYVSGFGDAVPTSLTITNSELNENSVVGMGGAIQSGIAVTLRIEDSYLSEILPRVTEEPSAHRALIIPMAPTPRSCGARSLAIPPVMTVAPSKERTVFGSILKSPAFTRTTLTITGPFSSPATTCR